MVDYSFGNYVPRKNCKPVEYEGVKYLSMAQCMALTGISRYRLTKYMEQHNLN